MQPEHDHSPDGIAARLAAGPRVSYLRDFVLGGIDGAVTTFAIVAGMDRLLLTSRWLVPRLRRAASWAAR